MNIESAGRNRMTFLDNARSLLVLGVVVLHAACGYANIIPWWHVRDITSPLADIVVAVLDVFLMPLLFFIAGFFAPSSIWGRSAGGFVARKAKRLLGPLIPLTLFYLPGMVYLGYLARTPDPKGFFAFWLQSLAALADMRPHLLESYEQSKPYLYDLSLHHLWFLSLLFAFFVLFALARNFFPEPCERTVAKKATFFKTFFVSGLLMALCATAINCAMPAGSWFKWNILLLFQPIRLPLYFGMFLLGAWSRTQGWLTHSPFPGGVWRWFAGALFLLAGVLVLGNAPYAPQVPFGVMAANAFLRTLANLCLAAFLCNICLRRLSKTSGASASLAASSYDVYLLHMPIVVFLERLLMGASLPVPVKLVSAALAASLISWGLSEKLVRPRPVTAFAALLLVFAIGCAVAR